MKKYLKIFGKLFLLALILIIADVIIGYTLEVSYSIFQKGIDSYYVEMGVLRMFFVMLGFYFFVAGWVYLVAVVLYHFYHTTEFLRTYFIYVILLFFVVYLAVNYKFVGISPYLVGYFTIIVLIYYGLSKQLFLQSTHVETISIFFIIFLLFFYFYWRMEELELWILIRHTLTYIPLAWLGQEIYSRLFEKKIISSA